MSPAQVTMRRGIWEPLPLIIYGYAIHPLSPSRRDTYISARTTDRLSTVAEGPEGDFANRDIVSLEVGDEIYAFEKYTPKGKECDGIWYRGYVVCTARRTPSNWASTPDVKTSKADEPQQIYIGIFPASHIYVRDELSDAEGRLADVASQFGSNKDPYSLSRDKGREMETLKEEDEHIEHASTRGFRLNPPPEQASTSRSGIKVYPASIRSASPSESQQPFKPLPPRPSLKSGDDTESGQEQPIIDEIASAIREWHNLMFIYLARRDYRLFYIVRDHIEALHLGRRQLLARTLSSEETVCLRRECVGRLVSGNVVQGLDIIVRHPSWGGLVTVDIEGDVDPRSWVSAVRMYAMQVTLAYMDVLPDASAASTKTSALGAAVEYTSAGQIASPVNAFPSDTGRARSYTRSLGSLAPLQPAKPASTKFYHVLFDLRAFVASPCSPGETCELYFSLYNKNDMRFVTEEFCAILNHNGVLARDPSTRIRTLFTDLVQTDVQEPIYLVCKIIRNGAMKISNSFSSGAPSDGVRRGSESSVQSRWDSPSTPNGTGTSSAVNTARSGTIADNSSNAQYRRPFGCAVLELAQLREFAKDQSEGNQMKEINMPIYVSTNEMVFSMLHQDIIANNSKDFEKSPRAEVMAVSVKFFYGDVRQIVRENPSLLTNVPLTARLGFPDVVFPGDVRNEVYIKLWSGEFFSTGGSSRLSVTNFARGSISAANNNVQVTVEVRDHLGNIIEQGIYLGSGEVPISQFHSLIFLRNNVPTFGELIKLKLPLNGPPNWHLYFTFRNRTPRERPSMRTGGDLEKPFAFAFLPLLPDARAFLEDGSHTLVLYRIAGVNQIPSDVYLARLPWTAGGQKLDTLPIDADLARTCTPIRDSFVVRTSLVSTKFTQNQVLLNLLYWDQVHDREMLSTILSKFTFVGEVEIVKFLRDIFDSLFAILTSHINVSGEMDCLVFNALVTVLGIVQDRRFSNFQPVLDVYIEEHFNCSSASLHIIQSINRLLADPSAAETAMQLRASLKVWHYLLKFIVRSRELQKAKEIGIPGGATAEHIESSFKRELLAHLTEVNRMMSTTSPASIIGTQTIALQHFTSILPELARVFPTVEVVSIVTSFANSVANAKGKIIIWKLLMYLQIVKGFLLDIPQSRSLLVEAIVIWIKPYFGRFDEYTQTQPGDSESARDNSRVSWLESTRVCIAIIAVMLDKLQQHLVNPTILADRNLLRQEQDNIEYLISLMPRLLDSYREFQNQDSLQALERTRSGHALATLVPVSFPESYPFSLFAHSPSTERTSSTSSTPSMLTSIFNCTLAEIAITLLTLMLSSPKKDIINFLESSLEIEGRDNFASFVFQFCKVSCSILDNEAFPQTWLNVNILAHKVLIRMVEPIASLMEGNFAPDHEEYPFNTALWREVLHMVLKLLCSEQLVIEEFTPQKRRAVWRLAGDIRGEGAAILLRLWDAISWPEQVAADAGTVSRYGNIQVSLNSLTGQVVNLCLSHHGQSRNNAVQILYSMIISEYNASHNFDEIENELVNKLDALFMAEVKSDDVTRTFFIGQLRQLFDSSYVDEQLRQRVSDFLDSVELFLELLFNVRALPDGEEFADDRVIATLRLMNYSRRIGRDEIYVKYVHELVNMHLQSQNYVEAALTLKLHSDLHEWDLNSFVEPMEDLGLPRQSQFHRKETLCLLILDYLGKGKAWEQAVFICDELAYHHSTITYNYSRLAEILHHKAFLLEHIVSIQRYYPDYFRVSFYGAFPSAIKNKHFIYRGYEWEKFGAFCERMLSKHPGSQLIRTISDPPVDIRFGNEQYIQCTAVIPEPDKTLAIFNNPDVPSAVRSYYEHSAINLFSCQHQVTKVGPNGEETWTMKTYFTTEDTFPTVLRRSEILDIHTAETSPLESALSDVVQKIRDLNALKTKYSSIARTGQAVSINALTMNINVAVEAQNNGGITLYRDVFLKPEYVEQYPERSELVQKLSYALDEYVRTIHSCLKLHASLCPLEMMPLHDSLERLFRKNFSDELIRLSMETSPIVPSTSPASRFPPQGPLARLHERNRSQASNVTSVSTQSKMVFIPPLHFSRQFDQTHPPPSPLSVQTQIPADAASVMTATRALPASSGTGLGFKPRLKPNMGAPNNSTPPSKQTLLQRNLAHLARHGFPGVSSSPSPSSASATSPITGPIQGDTQSIVSPESSFVNVSSSLHAAGSMASGATSILASNLGTSIGSIKGRISRLGSLNFGRFGRDSRDAT